MKLIHKPKLLSKRSSERAETDDKTTEERDKKAADDESSGKTVSQRVRKLLQGLTAFAIMFVVLYVSLRKLTS